MTALKTATANVPAWAARLPEPEPLPRLRGDLTADVCVIGLGGSGLAAILRLLEAGLDVIGVDAGEVAGGAAGRNGGLLLAGTAAFHHEAVAQLGEAEALDWYRATQDEITRMLHETPDFVRRTGSLRIADNAAELADCERQLDVMQAHGLPARRWSGPEGDGLLFPDDAVFNPLARVRELARRAVGQGARLFAHSPATLHADGSVWAPEGAVRARSVIVAVDGNLGKVLPELEGDVRPLRLQMLATEPVSQRFPRPVYRRHGFEYWQQLEDGRLLLGGFRDRGGPGEWAAEPVPGEAVQSHLTAFLRQQLGVKAEVTHRWAATVGYRESLLPYCGQVRPSVWALGGYNGTGNVIGALLGRRIAAEVIAAG